MKSYELCLSFTLSCVLVGASTDAQELSIHPVGIKLIEEAEVPAREAGVLLQISAHEGQRVTAGTILAQIDDRDAQLELQRAAIDRENALALADNDLNVRSGQEVLKLARLDLNRATDTINRYAKSVSQAEIDRLRVSVERARLDVEQAEKDLITAKLALKAAENQLQIAERNVQRRLIVAPIDGIVVAINYRKGEWVKPGDKVLRLVHPGRLRAEGFVHVRDLSKEIDNRQVTLKAEIPGHGPLDFPGKLTFVSPEANPVNGQVRVWAEIDNCHGRLRPGMSGTLVVHEDMAAGRK